MIQPKILIVDYGVGNTHSIWNALRSLDYRRLKISIRSEDLNDADAIVLPGVGAFETCIKNIKESRLDLTLGELVTQKRKPIIGICVGMQLMADSSAENGFHEGLGWIPGRVLRLDPPNQLTVPHVGWNQVTAEKSSPMFSRTGSEPHFYFDHSYHYLCDSQFVAATCFYGISVTAAIMRGNIHGVQFHPEKSQLNGLKLFRGFFNYVAEC
jgi:glutamine amidotransferase